MEHVPAGPAPGRSVVTPRALVLGLGMVLIVCVGAPYSIWMVGSSEITWSFFPIGVGVPFIVTVLANAAVRRWRPALALRPAEMVTLVSMGLVASGIPIFVLGLLFSIPSKPYYGATPENAWELYVQPYLPQWLIPDPANDAMRYFYEGLPSGTPLPLGAWLGPLLWWLSLILVVYFICFCVVVVLRKQWVQHERLAFPVTEVPRLLSEEGGSALPPILHTRVFWIGCAVPLGILLFNAISFFCVGFPTVPVPASLTSVQLFRGAPTFQLHLYFPIVGFMYFVSTSISFSVWFFFIVALLETGLLGWAGVVAEPDTFVYGSMTTLAWQAFGAFVAMVLWSVWMARQHLRAVLRHVFQGSRELDDSEEMVPYRVAVYGALAGALYVLALLWLSGMGPLVSLLFLCTVLVIYLGMTRLVVQAGLYYLTTPMAPQAMVTAITGTDVAPPTLTALALSYSWCSDIQSIFMPAAAHAAKLNELSSGRRMLALAIGLAVLVGFASTTYLVLHLCYRYGASNFRSWFFDAGGGAGGMAFDTVVRQLRNPAGTDWKKLTLFAVGALIYSLLSVCHYRFDWWPLHPVGLTTSTLWMMSLVGWSVFISWALKSIILRLGGIYLFRELRPLFVGMIVGFFLGVGVSYAIDAVWFLGKGHAILHG